MKTSNHKVILATIFLFAISIVDVLSQPYGIHKIQMDATNGFDNNYVVNGTETPIDDFIPVLIIAAYILGVWALNKNKKSLSKV